MGSRSLKKGNSLLRQEREVGFGLIQAEKAQGCTIPIRVWCAHLDMTVSGYHAFVKRPEGTRVQENVVLLKHIEDLFEDSKHTYGAPRITAALRDEGFEVSRKRVARLMHKQGLHATIPRAFVKTTDSNHDNPTFANVIDRNFEVDAPNTLWLTDITYIHTTDGFLYLAAVMDAFSRKIIGYSIEDHMETSLCEEALQMALRNRKKHIKLIHHSDRGSQYTSHRYQKLLEEAEITCSMSRVGQCWDNAMMESFFGTLKKERIYRMPLMTKAFMKQDITQWIETWYNSRRIHSKIGYKSPMGFEAEYKNQHHRQELNRMVA